MTKPLQAHILFEDADHKIELADKHSVYPTIFDGLVDDKPFFFVSRHGNWSLILNIDPELNTVEHLIFDSNTKAWFRRGSYESRERGYDISREEAESIVLATIREYWSETAVKTD